MLIFEAEILFETEKNNPTALTNDLDTKHAIRPAINFGNGLLLSGSIIPKKGVVILIRGNRYNVSIEMPTVENEAYEAIKDLVRVDSEFLIQSGSRIIGKGKIKEFLFE